MKSLLKNPITQWIKWWIFTKWLLYKNRGKHLELRYLSIVNGCAFGEYNTFYDYSNINNSTFGNFVYVGQRTIINNASIGNYCSIAPDVKIGLGIHSINLISTFPAFYSMRKQCQITFVSEGDDLIQESGKITIGNDVWIGANAIILDNVTIGNGAIIAAGAIVNKDVPPYSIVAGVPARFIKSRFSEEEINILLKSKWWLKDISWIKENYKLFNNPKDFFKLYDCE